MVGFSVYLQALIDSARNLKNASDALDEIVKIADGAEARAAANALGVIGQQASFPENYNRALDTISARATEGCNHLHGGSLELIRAERHYAEKDQSYAKKFGIMDDGRRPTVPSDLGRPKSTN